MKPQDRKSQLLIVGCGYVGMTVAKFAKTDRQVFALTRDATRCQELSLAGISPIVGNWLHSDSLPNLDEFDQVLVAVPHRAAPEFDERTHAVGLGNLLSKVSNPALRLLYLSTTGVYGAAAEGQVDEDSPVNPSRIGGTIAVQGEKFLSQRAIDASEWRHVVLRLAGIYGPGRIPLAKSVRNGEPLAVPQEGYLNLVHVQDIARAIICLLDRADCTEKLYVLSDGEPVQRLDFYRFLARLCGVDDPQFVLPDTRDSRSRRSGNKRINPQRFFQDTGLKLHFPSYREGLPNALEVSRQNVE